MNIQYYVLKNFFDLSSTEDYMREESAKRTGPRLHMLTDCCCIIGCNSCMRRD